MDIPEGGQQSSNVPRIRNIHPSQLPPDQSYGAIQGDEPIPIERTKSSISERFGSFVGSYSRTSMMFMAENLAVPNGPLVRNNKSLCFFFLKLKRGICCSSMTKKTNILGSLQDLFQESRQNNRSLN